MRSGVPRMAARCRRVSPRSFLLFTLSLVFEAELRPLTHTLTERGALVSCPLQAKERMAEVTGGICHRPVGGPPPALDLLGSIGLLADSSAVICMSRATLLALRREG